MSRRSSRPSIKSRSVDDADFTQAVEMLDSSEDNFDMGATAVETGEDSDTLCEKGVGIEV